MEPRAAAQALVLLAGALIDEMLLAGVADGLKKQLVTQRPVGGHKGREAARLHQRADVLAQRGRHRMDQLMAAGRQVADVSAVRRDHRQAQGQIAQDLADGADMTGWRP